MELKEETEENVQQPAETKTDVEDRIVHFSHDALDAMIMRHRADKASSSEIAKLSSEMDELKNEVKNLHQKMDQILSLLQK